MKDGSYAIFLSTRGENNDDVPEALVKFLKFVRANLEESKNDFKDPYVEKLQKDIRKIKVSREMGQRYMLFEELLAEERKEEREATKMELIRKKLAKGLSISQIAEYLEEEEDTIREYVERIEAEEKTFSKQPNEIEK